jgi:hypothetical protein
MYVFSLQRFARSPDPVSPRLAITGTALRQGGVLSLHYRVAGDIGGLDVPGPRQPGRRRHELWRHSCFECFIGQKTAAEYWEVNLAPNGDWNVYHFDGYRTGMVEETALWRFPCAFHAGRKEVRVGMEIDLSPIIREEQTLELGICAVLEHRHGEVSYWALRHRGTGADFHHRSGFELTL